MASIEPHFKLFEYLIEQYNIKSVLELGVHEGHSTKFFLKKLNGVWSIDKKKPLIQINDVKWHFIKSKDLDVSWTSDIPLLLIDTDPTPKHLEKQLDKFGSITEIILVHDSEIIPGLLDIIKKYCKSEKLNFVHFPRDKGMTLIYNGNTNEPTL